MADAAPEDGEVSSAEELLQIIDAGDLGATPIAYFRTILQVPSAPICWRSWSWHWKRLPRKGTSATLGSMRHMHEMCASPSAQSHWCFAKTSARAICWRWSQSSCIAFQEFCQCYGGWDLRRWTTVAQSSELPPWCMWHSRPPSRATSRRARHTRLRRRSSPGRHCLSNRCGSRGCFAQRPIRVLRLRALFVCQAM